MSATTYHRAAGILWAIVGILAGLTIGTYLGITDRRLVFFAAVGVGLVLLVRINRPQHQTQQKSETQPHLPTPNTIAGPLAEPKPFLSTVADQNRVLSPTEAREWLDELLVKQQQK